MNELQKFALEHKPMFWDVSHETLGNMSDQAIVERFMTLGTWEDFFTLQKLIGKKEVKDIFFIRSRIPRTNFRVETIDLFNHYYEKYPV